MAKVPTKPFTFEIKESLTAELNRLIVEGHYDSLSQIVRAALEVYRFHQFRPSKDNSSQLSVRLPEDVRSKILATGEKYGCTHAEIIRVALESFIFSASGEAKNKPETSQHMPTKKVAKKVVKKAAAKKAPAKKVVAKKAAVKKAPAKKVVAKKAPAKKVVKKVAKKAAKKTMPKKAVKKTVVKKVVKKAPAKKAVAKKAPAKKVVAKKAPAKKAPAKKAVAKKAAAKKKP
jgi:metal-responsive CopG/Arc/MetJ family transcriptional regulator